MMSSQDSNLQSGKRKARIKPKKPHPDFPLFPHATGRWAKKVRGKLHYFGPWEDSDAALELWISQKDELLAGRKPRSASDENALNIADACNLYLDHILDQVDKGRRTAHWYQDMRGTCSVILTVFVREWGVDSLKQDDFKLLGNRFEKTSTGKKASPVTTKNHIHRTRNLFNWLVKANYIETLPRYGAEFDPPESVQINNHTQDSTTRLFTRKQVRALLRATKGDEPKMTRMHAAILLAINTGCQNIDIQGLQAKHIDWKQGWYNQPRNRRAKRRRAKLWGRTVKAILKMVGNRQLEPDSLVFLSDTNSAWHGRNCIAKEFKPIRIAAGIDIDRCGFQWLRHTFITRAMETGDRDAVKIACGHASRDITDNYVHSVFDQRQIAIANHVERWLVEKPKRAAESP